MIRNLRAHAKRSMCIINLYIIDIYMFVLFTVDEHKKMVAKKVKERGLSVGQPERDVVSPELRHLKFEENIDDDEGVEEVGSDGFPADFGHTSRLQQLLECEGYVTD